MRIHVIEGAPGCAYAVKHGCTAVIVDAMRASATAAFLLECGAADLLIVREVEEALAAKTEQPDALVYGERGGLPPEGFDFGNSPREAEAARDRRVIFSTTTGAGRLVAAWGAKAAFMGSTVNASSVAAVIARYEADAVLIPAGLATDDTFFAQEDWAAATAIAMKLAAQGAVLGEGAEDFAYWRERIIEEGLPRLFDTAPHADKLRKVGLTEDIAFSAQMDICRAVPIAVERTKYGVRCARAS